MKMNGRILGLAACALLVSAGAAFAQDPCKPVTTAPGIKAVPAGCNKFTGHGDATGSIAKPGAPAAKPSALFPGASPGSIVKFGETEVRMNGRVRYDFGYGR